MPSPRRAQFPTPALDWIAQRQGSRVLNLGGRPALPMALATRGHHVLAVDKDVDRVQALTDRGLVAVAAEAEALPFDPCQFDVVTAHQVFHRFAPGLVLSEMARVLKPGGVACVSWLVRDDTVPWVRRLIKLLRQVDEDAMRGDYGADAVEALVTSKYFPEVEQRGFRIWQGVSRADLLAMVAAQPGVARLDPDMRQLVLDDAEELYHQASPAADDLRLPYELKVWRAWVDHEELTAPIDIDDTGLVIPL